MRKMGTTRLTYFRLDTSTYHGPHFLEREREEFSKLGIENASDPHDALVLISNTHTDFKKLNWKELKAKLIIHPNSGHDNIPIEFLNETNIPIICGNSIRSHGVAEYTLSRVFHHFSSLDHSPEWKPGRSWNRQRLADKNVLIIGHGLIGKIIHKSLTPLVKNITIHDPFLGMNALETENIDILLLAASLNPTSYHIVNKELLERLNNEWLLVNGARGKLVQQEDLLKTLANNPKATAYLDVFENEPFEENLFKDIPNLFCSSHVAGVSENLDQIIIEFEVEVIKTFITQGSNIREIYKDALLQNKVSPDNSFLI